MPTRKLWTSLLRSNVVTFVFGVTTIGLGILLNPSFLAKHLSHDGVLLPSTVANIFFADTLVVCVGIAICLYSLYGMGKLPCADSLSRGLSIAREALNRHLFAPLSPTYLAVARIALVSLQLFYLLDPRSFGIEHHARVGIRAQLWYSQMNELLFEPLLALKIMLLPLGWGSRPEPWLIQALWIIGVIAGVFALIGLQTRVALLSFAAINLIFCAHAYSYGEFHHPDALFAIALWLIALGPSAAAYSLDSRLNRLSASYSREEAQALARWPLRTIQWLLVLTYASAGVEKLARGGVDWLNGYTLAYYFIKDGLWRDMPLGPWLAQGPISVLVALSIAAIAFELTFGLAVLIPRLALPYVLIGTGFHLAIFFTQRAQFFQFITLYVVFGPSICASRTGESRGESS